MSDINFATQLYCLSSTFYTAYPNSLYPEILYDKGGRPYNCLVIESKADYFICIPFRSSMKHKYGYKFRSSKRSKRTPSGLDYKKTVIICKKEYFDLTKPVIVDNDEYKEAIANIKRIVREVNKFIDDYIDCKNGVSKISVQEYGRRYNESTLQYFHAELGIK